MKSKLILILIIFSCINLNAQNFITKIELQKYYTFNIDTTNSLNIRGVGDKYAVAFELENVNQKTTFNKSTLIKYDNPIINVDSTVKKLHINDSIRTASIIFPTYFKITNISKHPIWCTEELYFYSDTQIRGNYNNLVLIKPGEIYQIKIWVREDRCRWFKKLGDFVVYSEHKKIAESHRISVENTLFRHSRHRCKKNKKQ